MAATERPRSKSSFDDKTRPRTPTTTNEDGQRKSNSGSHLEIHHDGRPRSRSLLDALKSAADALMASPSLIRKSLAPKKADQGKGDYAALKDGDGNGWLHTDEAVQLGIAYKITYLGSISCFFDPLSTAGNYQYAKNAIDQVMTKKNGKGQAVTLTVSSTKVTMASQDEKLLMRHSTSRIAFSTVDHDAPWLFCYMTLVKGSTLTTGHVFLTKSKLEGFDLTFTCAQAFDMNYRIWKESRLEGSPHAHSRAEFTETDIEVVPEFTQYKTSEISKSQTLPRQSTSSSPQKQQQQKRTMQKSTLRGNQSSSSKLESFADFDGQEKKALSASKIEQMMMEQVPEGDSRKVSSTSKLVDFSKSNSLPAQKSPLGNDETSSSSLQHEFQQSVSQAHGLSSSNPFLNQVEPHPQSPRLVSPTVVLSDEEDHSEIDSYFSTLSKSKNPPNIVGVKREDFPRDDEEDA